MLYNQFMKYYCKFSIMNKFVNNYYAYNIRINKSISLLFKN